MKLKTTRKTHRKGSLKLSSKRQRKNNPRRLRNNLRKISLILIPVSFIISIICIAIIIFLAGASDKTSIISPLAMSKNFNAFRIDSKENELRNFLEREKISFKKIEMPEDEYFKITLEDDSEIFISANRSLPRALSSLQYILSRLTMEGREFARLDLRYEKPIIVFK